MAKKRHRVRSLPVADWPRADRDSWQAACVPARRLRPGGAASRMRPHVQAWQARCYGYLLDYCQRTGVFDPEAAPAMHGTPEIVAGFLDELQHRVGSVTRALYLRKALRVAEILAPERDFAWLRQIAKELAQAARPRPKQHRLVTADRLRALGMGLMARAEAPSGLTPLQSARLYRDGLMIALLTYCPVRLSNLAHLRLGQQLRRIDGAWWILLSAQETKSKRPDERPLPDSLVPHIERWLTHWRPQFRDAADFLWPSTKGGGLSYTYTGMLVSKITQRELGVAVNSHLFRDCDVHTIALRAGGEMGLASALLQHSDPRTTEKYYNKGASIEASRAYRQIVDRLMR